MKKYRKKSRIQFAAAVSCFFLYFISLTAALTPFVQETDSNDKQMQQDICEEDVIRKQMIDIPAEMVSKYVVREKKSAIDQETIQPPLIDFPDTSTFMPGEMLIKFKSDSETVEKEKILESVKQILIKNSSFVPVVETTWVFGCWCKFSIPQNNDVAVEIEKYKHDPLLQYLISEVQPNYRAELYFIPNDPFFSMYGSWGQIYPDLWGLHQIDMQSAWDITTGSSDVVVAVVDTGVDYNHPDIQGNMWFNQDEIPGNGLDDDHDGFVDNLYGADFAYGDGDPIDGHGHGTHCAGTIAAVGNNTLGVVGVNWLCRVMAVKAMSDSGSGTYATLSAALVWAVDQGANVISNSWGSGLPIASNPIIEDAVRYAYSQRCIVVFAAGNSNDNARFYSPQNMPEVITVAATDYQDRKAGFSNWGEQITVCAPGVDVLSLRANHTDMYGDGEHIVGEDYYRASGTSMACPHVAGLVALLLAHNHSLTTAVIKNILRATSDDIKSTESIGGRINASDALMGKKMMVAQLEIPMWANCQGTIAINGTAWGESFAAYMVDYGKGRKPSFWMQLIESSTPVQHGVLTSLDTTDLDEGTYTIRLRVICSNEKEKLACQMIVVNNEQNLFIVDANECSKSYRCIQDAVNDSGENDTVFVRIGTYNESLLLDRPLRLVGEDRDATIIKRPDDDTGTCVMRIVADGVHLENMTLYPGFGTSHGGIDVRADHNTIDNTIIYGGRGGIRLLDAHCNMITGTMIHVNDAVYIDGSSNNTVSGNTLWGERYSGLFVWISFFNTISNNTITGFWEGVDMQAHARGNVFARNFIAHSSVYGILFIYYCNNNTIAQNTIVQNHRRGIYLEGVANNNTIIDNLMADHDEYGLMTQTLPFFGGNPNDNNMYRNSFIANDVNVLDPFPTNMWYNDTIKQGNYWSDYQEKYPFARERPDLPGIWDTPYRIPGGNNYDEYPLIRSPLFTISNGPYEGATGEQLHFNGGAYGGTSPYIYQWDFGDGNTSDMQNTIHAYTRAATYLVTLTVTDRKNISKHTTIIALVHRPRVHNLNQNRGYWTLQRAIDDADPGDTLHADSAIYCENIYIAIPLTLQGENRDTTIIDGCEIGTVVDITANMVHLHGFTIQHSSGYNDQGILVYGNDMVIEGNRIISNGDGITIHRSTTDTLPHNITITGNVIAKNFMYGIRSTGYNILFANNTINQNYAGILVGNASYHIIINNTIINNTCQGILVLYTHDTDILNNIISHHRRDNDSYAMFLKGNSTCPSTYTMIAGNTIINNTHGVYSEKNSTRNVLWHNTFIGNNQNAYDEGVNTWYNSTRREGNHWDDYNGTDANGDGIGDTPYNITGRLNQDNYPLMHRFLLGDMNVDGVVDSRDIDPFVLALSNPEAYKKQYHMFMTLHGDINQDGLLNFDDIDPFVVLLNSS